MASQDPGTHVPGMKGPQDLEWLCVTVRGVRQRQIRKMQLHVEGREQPWH